MKCFKCNNFILCLKIHTTLYYVTAQKYTYELIARGESQVQISALIARGQVEWS